MKSQNLLIKVADQPWELDEICRLNHQTFSVEIPQHNENSGGMLIDKFHEENQYIICLDKSELVGMVAFRHLRPFSLDSKVNNIEQYLPPHKSLCELRLLSIKPTYRKSKVFYLLFRELFNQFNKMNYDFALITGILSQQKLYKSIGCVAFGPIVGDSVKFQPMYATPELFFKSRHKSLELTSQKEDRVNALPGPVDIKDIVVQEFKNKPISHRSADFIKDYKDICIRLCKKVGSENVQIFTGSGTLANEVMLAHLYSLNEKGLILSNGEFGNRIIHQAKCQNVRFDEYKVGSGFGFDYYHIEKLIINDPKIKWLFFVHCETSSGSLNDLRKINSFCKQMNVKVVVDCISTFGIVPIDLENVYLASASSGKAVGSYSGLSMVFYNNLIEVKGVNLPVYLDIRYYIEKNGIPFTLNSNLIKALGVALNITDVASNYLKVKKKTEWLRNKLSKLAFEQQLFESNAMHPAIITIKLPESIKSSEFGILLYENNIQVNYNSDHLLNQNLIQICLFSEINEVQMNYIISVFKKGLSQLSQR